jgi:hypothetical protein
MLLCRYACPSDLHVPRLEDGGGMLGSKLAALASVEDLRGAYRMRALLRSTDAETRVERTESLSLELTGGR